MKVYRFWIEIVAAGTGVACAIALLIATLGTMAGAGVSAMARPQGTPTATQQTYEGVVTCSRCGARHSAKLGATAADCALVCIRGGAKFALIDGEKTYQLDGNLSLLRRVVGERTQVGGVMTGNTIRVSSVAPGT